jgi:uncharacterized protein YndB with AHSA1/START domain
MAAVPTPGPFLQLRRTFSGPPERVFRAWTDPDEVRQWFGPGEYTTPQVEIDLRVGGRYRFGLKPPRGDMYFLSGEYREIVPPRRLVYTWAWEGGDHANEMLVTVDFLDRGGRTELIIHQEQFATQEQCDQHAQGWKGTLDKLNRQF